MRKKAIPDSSTPRRRDKICGVFSTRSLATLSDRGSLEQKTTRKTYWFVKELLGEQLEVQPLNANYIPSGPKKTISLDEFLEKFLPEPEFYTYTVFPLLRRLNTSLTKSERFGPKGGTSGAEFEYSTVLAVDEETIRGNFGLGLTYLERGESAKAADLFERLVKLDASFEVRHKHLFNGFGISLRKSGMYDQAVAYYTRGLELAHNDENLHFNIARAYFEQGEIESTVSHLSKALEINPELKEARRFLEFLGSKGRGCIHAPD
jgi:tetratricopeptide (TPR) repeat protein